MSDHVYKLTELVGSSEKSIEDAIQTAITRAASTLRGIRWFEIVESRGQVIDGRVAYYQVTLKVGFALESDDS